MRTTLRTLLGLAAAVLVSGCGSTEPAKNGQLVVRLTDSPADHVQSATVWISSVYLIPGTDANGERLPVASYDPAREYDLMTLRNGVTAELGTATIDVGDYSQLRLVVDSAKVTLSDLTFSDGSSTILLKTPSAQQTGIKVNFGGPLHVEPGQTVLVVDFDVRRNFVFTGPSDAPNGMLFKPVLHATVQDIASTISGKIDPAEARASALVLAILPKNWDPLSTDSDTVASATPDLTTGAYVLRYLDPRGSEFTPFTVSASATGYKTQWKSVGMTNPQGRNDVLNVDFTLAP